MISYAWSYQAKREAEKASDDVEYLKVLIVEAKWHEIAETRTSRKAQEKRN